MNWMCSSCIHNGENCEGCNPDDPTRSDYQSLLGKRGSNFKDAAVQCPFYKRVAKKQKMIVCEGIWDETVATSYFSRRDAMMEQVKECCEKDYKSCRLYKLIMNEKYGGG